MHLPFPERVPILWLGSFAGLIVLLQQVQGTSFAFSVLSFLFIAVAGYTFNLAGGLTRASGGYVFFYSVLGVIVGLVGKVVFGEPGDSNLLQPVLTMEVFLGGICGMLGAVLVSRKLTRKRALLQNVVPPSRMQDATVGCMIVGIGFYIVSIFDHGGASTLVSAFNQLNRFLPLAIIFGVTHQIRKTGGRQSVNSAVFITWSMMFVCYGLIGFSKEGMFTPLLCWVVAAGAQRYRVSLLQVVGIGLALVFTFYYLVPYSQDGRNYKSETGSFFADAQISWGLLQHLDLSRDRYEEANKYQSTQSGSGYFTHPVGFLDRLQMISMDDRLVDVTERGAIFGLSPVVVDFENLVPHFLWPDKPTPFYGNVFAHEIGGLAEDDTTTGVSFTPSGEAFHLAKWTGVLIVAPLIWALLFTTIDSLCGDVRKSPWGLLMIALFAHVAPEGMLNGAVYTVGYGSLSLIFGAFTSAYVMPVMGRLATGSRTRFDLERVVVRPLPRRVAPLEPNEGAV